MVLDKYYHAPTKVFPLPPPKMRTKYKSFGNACFNYSRTFPPPPQGETKEGRVRLFVSFNFLPGAIWNAFSLTLAAFNIKR